MRTIGRWTISDEKEVHVQKRLRFLSEDLPTKDTMS